MKKEKLIRMASIAFILFSAFSLLMVSLMAFANPQSVMDLVSVKLTNNDAFSSIRGIYDGVGLSLVISLMYLLRKNRIEALMFLTVLWGLYAMSRLITIMIEGPLGDFGTQWIITESVLCGIALLLLRSSKQVNQAAA
jgi:O-antigen/teichoic acid export membrane protein